MIYLSGWLLSHTLHCSTAENRIENTFDGRGSTNKTSPDNGKLPSKGRCAGRGCLPASSFRARLRSVSVICGLDPRSYRPNADRGSPDCYPQGSGISLVSPQVLVSTGG